MQKEQKFERGKLYASFNDENEIGNVVIATGVRNHDSSFEGISLIGYRSHLNEKIDWKTEDFVHISKYRALSMLLKQKDTLFLLATNRIFGADYILNLSDKRESNPKPKHQKIDCDYPDW